MTRSEHQRELWRNPEYRKHMSEVHKGQHSSLATEFKKGCKNPYRFNNGLCYDKNKNIWLIWCRDNTFIAFYRAIIECQLKRILTQEEVIHHINGKTTDDRIENLILTTRSNHVKFHIQHIRKGKTYKDFLKEEVQNGT